MQGTLVDLDALRGIVGGLYEADGTEEYGRTLCGLTSTTEDDRARNVSPTYQAVLKWLRDEGVDLPLSTLSRTFRKALEAWLQVPTSRDRSSTVGYDRYDRSIASVSLVTCAGWDPSSGGSSHVRGFGTDCGQSNMVMQSNTVCFGAMDDRLQR